MWLVGVNMNCFLLCYFKPVKLLIRSFELGEERASSVPPFYRQASSLSYAKWIIRNSLKAQYADKAKIFNHLIIILIAVQSFKTSVLSEKKKCGCYRICMKKRKYRACAQGL